VVLDALGESVGADEDIAGFASCDDDQPSGESPAESESALVGGAAERAAALLGCVSVLLTSEHVSMLPAAAQSIVLPCGRLDDDLSDDDLLGDLAGSSQAVPLARPLAPSALREVVK
jgi:hypothetical protein